MRLRTTRLVLQIGLLITLITAPAAAQSAEQRTSRYLDSVRKQPGLLLAFLEDMPKGGDLHNHLDGAIYAEDLIDYAASGGLCVERTSSQLIAPPCDPCETYTAKPAACSITR
jgi:adenosine deaminase